MTTHASKLIGRKKLTDGQFAVLIRCCGDQTTDSWHTLSVTKDTAKADVTAWIAGRQQHVEDGHAVACAVDTYLGTVISEYTGS